MSKLYRRNFFPTFIVNAILWLILIFIVLCLSPEKTFNFKLLTFNFVLPTNLILFFLVLTMSLILTLALLLGNTRRGFLATLAFVIVLILRLAKLDSWWNILLVLVFFLLFEIIFSKKESKKNRQFPATNG